MTNEEKIAGLLIDLDREVIKMHQAFERLRDDPPREGNPTSEHFAAYKKAMIDAIALMEPALQAHRAVESWRTSAPGPGLWSVQHFLQRCPNPALGDVITDMETGETRPAPPKPPAPPDVT